MAMWTINIHVLVFKFKVVYTCSNLNMFRISVLKIFKKNWNQLKPDVVYGLTPSDTILL